MTKAVAMVRCIEIGVEVMASARAVLFQRLPRLFFFAGLSVVSGVLLLGAKVWLFVVAPDWFLLANIAFVSGAIATKIYLLRRRKLMPSGRSARTQQLGSISYRRTGVVIVVLSAAYLLALLPAMMGTHTFLGQDAWAAIVIAAVAFTELTLAIVAAVAGRRDSEPIASAIRRVNIATALVMIALAQSALVTAFGGADSSKGTAAAIAFGVAAGVVGAGMFGRRRSWTQ